MLEKIKAALSYIKRKVSSIKNTLARIFPCCRRQPVVPNITIEHASHLPTYEVPPIVRASEITTVGVHFNIHSYEKRYDEENFGHEEMMGGYCAAACSAYTPPPTYPSNFWRNPTADDIVPASHRVTPPTLTTDLLQHTIWGKTALDSDLLNPRLKGIHDDRRPLLPLSGQLQITD